MRSATGRSQIRSPGTHRSYVDFVCRERCLIIQLDGGQHSERSEDKQHDNALCALGYRVIRVWNNDVTDNLDGVLQVLLSELEKQPLTLPSPRKRGEGDKRLLVPRL